MTGVDPTSGSSSVDLPVPVDRRKAFSASNAARFIACPASADLANSIPGWTPPVVDPMKGAKGKGTTMHAWLEETSEWSAQDLRHMSQALAYMADLRSKRRFKVLAEQSAVAEWLESKPRTTCDVVLYVQDELHVVDYKWGKIPVDIDNNEQLLYYAVTFGHLAPKAKGVTVHIVQPPAGIFESRFISAAELAAYMAKAQAAEKLVLAGDKTFGPSDHCKFCPANPHSRGDKGRPLCPAMMGLLYPSIVDEDEILGR